MSNIPLRNINFQDTDTFSALPTELQAEPQKRARKPHSSKELAFIEWYKQTDHLDVLLLKEVMFLANIGKQRHPTRKGFYSECSEAYLSERTLTPVRTVRRRIQKLKRLRLLSPIYRRPVDGKPQTNLLCPLPGAFKLLAHALPSMDALRNYFGTMNPDLEEEPAATCGHQVLLSGDEAGVPVFPISEYQNPVTLGGQKWPPVEAEKEREIFLSENQNSQEVARGSLPVPVVPTCRETAEEKSRSIDENNNDQTSLIDSLFSDSFGSAETVVPLKLAASYHPSHHRSPEPKPKPTGKPTPDATTIDDVARAVAELESEQPSPALLEKCRHAIRAQLSGSKTLAAATAAIKELRRSREQHGTLLDRKGNPIDSPIGYFSWLVSKIGTEGPTADEQRERLRIEEQQRREQLRTWTEERERAEKVIPTGGLMAAFRNAHELEKLRKQKADRLAA